jgi:Tol biopolymer transport system component
MDEQRLERALRQGPGFATRYVARPPVLAESLVAQRSAGGGRLALMIAVTALLVGLVAGAIAVGSGLVKLPVIVPVPSDPPLVRASPSASSSLVPQPQFGVVAYEQSGRIWVVNTDGTDARQLVPVERDPEKPRYLDMPDEQYPIAWSPDGSRLYYRFERVERAGPEDGIGTPHGGLAVTDAAGSAPVELLDLAGETGTDSGAWCPAPSDNCGRGRDGGISISPDATRLAYAIEEGDDSNISTIVVLDIPSGQITRLQATRTENPGIGPSEGPTEACTAVHGGYNGNPQWSPDGTKLVFTRTDCHNAIFTIGADGNDLREVVPFEWGPQVFPRWSPDGSRILFHSPTNWDDSGEPGRVDIATVRPDGTGFQTLTSDGVSVWPYWTRDGRIVFVRWTLPDGGAGDLWVMDGDGGNAAQVAGTVPALTAVGCTVCPFPVAPNRYLTEGRVNERLWQTQPASQ